MDKAYFPGALAMNKKSFIMLTSGLKLIKLFVFVTNAGAN